MAEKKNTAGSPGRRGRKPKIIEFDLEKVELLARAGYTEEEIAARLGICRKTLYNYKQQNDEFLHTIKRGKDEADDRVVDSLHKRATGYRYIEKRVSKLTSPGEIKKAREAGIEVKGVVIRIDEIHREIPPDTGAACFWLKNRKPVQWRDKQEVEHSGNVGNIPSIDYSKYTTDELKELRELLEKGQNDNS